MADLPLTLPQGPDPLRLDVRPLPEAPEDVVERPAGLDVAAAAFRQQNVLSSLIAANQARAGDETPVEDFDPFEAVRGTPYADYAERFDGADSPAAVARVQRQIDRELADRRTLEAAGGLGLAATIGAGVTDPLFLATLAIPGGPAAGSSRAAAFGRTAMLGAASEAPLELALQATQQTRTAEEGLLNVGASTLLSGLLGAALVKRIPEPDRVALETTLRDELRVAPPSDGTSTVGAAAVARGTRLEDESIAAGGTLLSRTLGKTSPELRLMRSPVPEVRLLTQQLSEKPYLLEKNFDGIATPQAVETEIRASIGQWWGAYRRTRTLYSEYRARERAAGQSPMSRREFNEAVTGAMRRGDESLIPEVAAAAREWRARVYEPWKARAVKLGKLAADVQPKGAVGYAMRQFDVAKIRRNPRAWTQLLVDGFRMQGLDAAEALDVAHTVTRNILGSEQGLLDLDVVPASGRFKERTLTLPDEMLEPFLVSDIEVLSQAYLRTIAPEVVLTERFGDRELKSMFDAVRDRYGVLKAQALAGGDEAALTRLQAREEADLRDLAAIRDRIYGTYGAPKDPSSFFVRAGRFMRSWNYVRLLGSQVLSAITDAARLTMIYGAPKMVASAMKLATSLRALKLTRDEARRMGVGLDVVLNTRGIALGDLNQYSSFAEQRVMRTVSDAFSMITLQAPWNAVMKSWASLMSQDDILRAAAGGSLSRTQRARMASLGLDEPMLARIAAQVREHGIEENGLRFGNSEEWADQEAARAFEFAVLREADTAVLTPGQGDLPLVYSTEWGKALLQFKSFGLASTSRLVIPIMQGFRHGDARMIANLGFLFGAGAASYVLRQLSADQPIEDDPTRFAMEIVDRTGVLAWSGDILFPALWQFGADDLSRWSDRQPVETIGGPVAGTIADLYTSRWPQRILDGEVNATDVHKVRRLLPGQNLFYARRLINDLEAELAPAEAAP